ARALAVAAEQHALLLHKGPRHGRAAPGVRQKPRHPLRRQSLAIGSNRRKTSARFPGSGAKAQLAPPETTRFQTRRCARPAPFPANWPPAPPKHWPRPQSAANLGERCILKTHKASAPHGSDRTPAPSEIGPTAPPFALLAFLPSQKNSAGAGARCVNFLFFI